MRLAQIKALIEELPEADHFRAMSIKHSLVLATPKLVEALEVAVTAIGDDPSEVVL